VDLKTGKVVEEITVTPTASVSTSQGDQKPTSAKAVAGEMDYDKLFGNGIV